VDFYTQELATKNIKGDKAMQRELKWQFNIIDQIHGNSDLLQLISEQKHDVIAALPS